ncbi:MAG: DUF4421 family protein [Bdellovibrionales bacterium]|nr:DUF4421 family protein [Bdellovibrionales bacterium]
MKKWFSILKKLIFLYIVLISPLSYGSIKDHSDQFAFGLVTETPGFKFSIQPYDESNKNHIDYRPNLLATLGFMVSAFGYSFSYLFQLDQTADEQAKKGKTSYDDIRLSKFFGSRKQWRVSTYYTRYSGFYIENSHYIDSTLGPSDPYIQRSDLKFLNGGLSLLHIFHPKEFSVAATTNFSDQQTESGGSWLLRLDFDYNSFRAASALVPVSVQSDFGADANISRGDFNTLSLLGGYGYSFVYNNFYLNPTVLIGKGIQQRKYTINGNEESSVHNSTKLNLSGALGYNGETFFTGFMVSFDQLSFSTGSIKIGSSQEVVRLTVGRRF